MKVGDKVFYYKHPVEIVKDLGVIACCMDEELYKKSAGTIQRLLPMQAFEVKMAHGAVVGRVPEKKLRANR